MGGTVLLLAIAAGALAIRLYQLDRRPLHHDEANQIVRAGLLQETGQYRYDPQEHHGPTLYYIAQPFAWLKAGRNFAGTTETTFRLVPVVFGVALLLLLPLVSDGLGRTAVLVSAALTAISPAMVYYNRFFIQETLLVFFTFGAIASGWRYRQTHRVGWALLAGAFLGLMYATKETCVLAFAAMVGACVIATVTRRTAGARTQWNIRHLFAAAAVFFLMAFLWYSSFFTNPRGFFDSVRAYFGVYLHRAGGENTDHVHPWYFYLQILAYTRNRGGMIWSEGLIFVLALVGAIAAWRKKESNLPWFIAVYTMLLTAFYSAIPYKTPWCLLSFWHGMILLAGFGAVALVRALPNLRLRLGLSLVMFAFGWQLFGQMRRANYRFPADPRNPYVYAQTVPDFLNLVKRVDDIAAVSPLKHELPIAVVAGPYEMWPLPWYLRSYPKVGYWSQIADVPADLNPAIVITSMELEKTVAPRFQRAHQVECYGLRPGVIMVMYIQQDLWDTFLEKRAGTAVR